MRHFLQNYILLLFTIIALQPHKVLLHHMKPVSTYDVLHFCQRNGLKYITFVSIDKGAPGPQLFLSQLIKEAHLVGSLRTRLIKTTVHEVDNQNMWSYHEYDKDTLVVIASPDPEDWMHYLNMISKTKIRSSIFVIVDPLKKKAVHEIRDILSNLSENVYFYLLYTEESSGPNLSLIHI